jgi:O-antigen ligase
MNSSLLIAFGIVSIALLGSRFFLRPAYADFGDSANFDRRFNASFGITFVFFFSGDFWLFLTLSALLLWRTAKRDVFVPALYTAIIFSAPLVSKEVPGFGLINYFFDLNIHRTAALVLLVPCAYSLISKQQSRKWLKIPTDYFISGFLVVKLIVTLDATTFSDALRTAVFYSFIDILLPYFVMSRAVNSYKKIREILFFSIVSVFPLAFIGAAEAVLNWLVFFQPYDFLGLRSGISRYIMRDGFLRALASTDHSIVLGYVFTVVLLLTSSVWSSMRPMWRNGVIGAGILGVITPFSRGPWVGLIIGVIVFALLSEKKGKYLSQLALLGVGGIVVLTVIPNGKRVLDFLPFIGSVDAENIDYRKQLFEVGWSIVSENPWFGSRDFLLYMEEMRQGQGIIDLVNTYLSFALVYGAVGLCFFVGAIWLPLYGCHLKARSKRLTKDGVFCRSFTSGYSSAVIASTVILGTASFVGHIAVLTWWTIGLGSAFAYNVNEEKSSGSSESHELRGHNAY